ncbi:MAG: LLM class F420-dependent oxidoreductase [Candidatus Dormibacteria bacterium]
MSAGPSSRFKLGVALPYSDFVPREEQLELVKRAEELGYHSVWTAEAYSFDAVTPLAWLAAHTSRIRLATGILNVYSRTPAVLAMTAASLDELSGGRFILGLGASGPKVVQGWHGLPYDRFVQRTRETIDIVRRIWRREPLTYQGQVFNLDGGLKLINHPKRADIPIFVAAMGPKNVSMTAELADGWLPFLYSPDRAEVFRDSLSAGAAASGRDLSKLDVMPFTVAAIDDDIEVGRALARPGLALYIGGMGTREKNFYNALVRRYGYEREAGEIQELYLAGRRDEAMSLVPDALVDETACIGDEARGRDYLGRLEASGCTGVVLNLAAVTPEGRRRTLEALAPS